MIRLFCRPPAPAKDAKGAPQGAGGVSLDQLKAAVADSKGAQSADP
jgi:hypothetical protein